MWVGSRQQLSRATLLRSNPRTIHFHRQLDDECRAFADFGFDVQRAAVLVDDDVGYGF